jgi:chemotaxis protein CheY-P-specific phosphatase CheC
MQVQVQIDLTLEAETDALNSDQVDELLNIISGSDITEWADLNTIVLEDGTDVYATQISRVQMR